MNLGRTPDEVAAEIELPASLARAWYNRGYYGTVKQNVRGVYDRYMGWYDGVPSNLDRLPPVERGKRLVILAGGSLRLMKQAEEANSRGDLQWAVELLQSLVFAEPTNAAAKARLADIYEQLGYRSESGQWRNIYFSAALDLRNPPTSAPTLTSSGIVAAMPTKMFFEAVATRLNPDRIGDQTFQIRIAIPDRGETALLTVRNRVLVMESISSVDGGTALEIPWQKLVALFGRSRPSWEVMKSTMGPRDQAANLAHLISALDELPRNFPIVTP